MQRNSLYFTAPREAALVREKLEEAQPGQLLVETRVSAISPGTELLVYRGQLPGGVSLDSTISALAGETGYPLKYGYAAAGKVIDCGPGSVRGDWLGKAVFAFHPHESHFWARPEELMLIPEGLSFEQAVFLANMETAVNFLMDGQPAAGEQVAVFGQGIVGLLTTALLSQHPLASLVTLDRYEERRKASLEAGAQASLDPSDAAVLEELLSQLQRERVYRGADLTFELSGAPETLNMAIAGTGFNGRIVIGSWYGQKQAPLNLGGSFHRSRIRLISSQVSSLTPELSGRWNKERRYQWAWDRIARIHPERWITQRIPLENASEGYQILDQRPGEAIQIVLTY